MKFVFEDKGHEGEFQFGGALTLTAENPSEVQALIDHFKLFSNSSDVSVLQKRIEALQSGTLTHTIYKEKRPVYAVNSCLDFEFIEPYKKWALHNFGFDGVFPDLEIPMKWGGLQYTNYKARLFTQCEHICFEAFTSAEPWAHKSAQDYAEYKVKDCIGEEFGDRYREPEFIQAVRSCCMKRNPNYLKRHAPKPAATNARLKRAFFEWWEHNAANDAQKAIIADNRDIVATTGSYMGAFEFECDQHVIYYGRELNKDGSTRDYKSMRFDEFAKLGNNHETL